MAVLDDLPGFDVSILVDNTALKEYDDDEEVTSAESGAIGEHQVSKTISKYIEAMSDKDFQIHLKLLEGHQMNCPTYTTIIRIDGQLVHRPIISKVSGKASLSGD